MKLRTLGISALILLVPALSSAIKLTRNSNVGDKVVSIVDGETFKLENKQTIRLASIDAPEIGNCYAKESKDALSSLILGKRVILQDPYADQYGRIIALVLSNGQVVNDTMVRNGYAVYTYDKTITKLALQDANKYARQNNLGIYSDTCSQVVPPNSRCYIKGNLDQREGRRIYSYPGCSNYEYTIVELFIGDRWFCSEKEALDADYIKSKNCPVK